MKAASIGILLFLLVTDVSSDDSDKSGNHGAGAVYTMTNGAKKNQVVIQRVGIDGRLTQAGRIDTNGIGVNSTAIDVVPSQGSLVVYSNYLFVVNPGSNSLSMFQINPSDATKLTLISVQPTNGVYPISVAVNSKYACVLTSGTQTGIRCFTYNSDGLFLKPSFDRDLTSYISHSIPLIDGQGTFSQILFSADDRCLIIDAKGVVGESSGYLLFYLLLNNGATLSLNPIQQTPPGAVFPFGMSLVGADGLLLTDGGSDGILTQKYSSTDGTIRDIAFTPLNASIAGMVCWSVYSPTTGNYYTTSPFPPALVELHVDLSSISNPVTIVRYYLLPQDISALDTTIVTIAGVDYLYTIGVLEQVIYSYRLNGPGNAVSNGIFVVQKNAENLPKLIGMAAYVQKLW